MDKSGGILRVVATESRTPSSIPPITTTTTVQPDIIDSWSATVTAESPQPSVDRLSVSFAPEDINKSWSIEADYPTVGGNNDNHSTTNLSDVSKVNVFNMTSEEIPGNLPSGSNRLSAVMTDDDDDYSASITAILHRRASARKVKGLGKRRTSSPMDSDRRRSSVFTTSSGDTAITMDGEGGGMGQEQIFENIRLHKEVLESVKQQPWEMRRKLKLVQQAKEYVRRHEGQLQERLAQSKNTKDIMARFNIILIRYWQYLKREASNLATNMIPWEHRIKEIESHFGSVVASYFTFLRWIFWINIVIAATLICFVIVPELLAADPQAVGSDRRKFPMKSEEKTSANLRTLWDFEGKLKYSPIFYGYFTDQHETKEGYPLPLGYFLTGLAVYVYSFVAILRRMADNSRQSKLSEKEDECIFSWKVFTGWDYMIGNPETAFNRFASITMGFKEALLEEKEKKKDERNWKIIGLRILANFLVVLLLISSAWAVVLVVARSERAEKENLTSWWRQNEITVVMSLITTIFPNIFELIGMMEKYHPRRQLRWQLARIMVLNFLNLYTLIFALFGKVINMTKELEALRPNATNSLISTTMSPYSFTPIPSCGYVDVINCTLLDDYHSQLAIKNTNTTVTFTTNVMTLTPFSTNFSHALANNDTFNLLSSARFNVTELWRLLHQINPKTDLSQVINSTLSNPEVQESLFEMYENENLTYWSKDSDFNLNDSRVLLPSGPRNRTSLAAALPLIIQIISSYLKNTLPSLAKTTPFYLNNSHNMTGTTTTGRDDVDLTTRITSSTEYPPSSSSSSSGSSDYSSTMTSVTTNKIPIFTPVIPVFTSRFSTIFSNPTRHPFRNYYNFGTSTSSPSSSSSSTTRRYRAAAAANFRTNRHRRRRRRRRRPQFGQVAVAAATGGTAPSSLDYPTTDISGEFNNNEDDGMGNGNDVEGEDENGGDDDDKEEEDYDDGPNNLDIRNKQQNGIHNDGKSSTRGDIPGDTSEDLTTSTTTTTPMPEPVVEEELEKFLTQIVTIVTMFLSHNSSKYDDAEVTRLQDFTKLVSTVFTRIDTWKAGSAPNFNSTFSTTYQTSVQDKEKKLCTVKVCEDGSSSPDGLKEVFNCTDAVCLLTILAGPRDDGCWVENTKLCIQASPPSTTVNTTVENKLRRLCWETMFGQELVKLTVMDLVFTVGFIFVIDFIRAILVRVLNPCWCWDLEKGFPQYGDFKIAENILHLVNNQGMIWMGMFFSPGLPTINLVKLVILMYIRSWAVMTCNVPHETVFRASRSNNFYFALLLFMLFLCTLPVGYAIVWLPPSWQCGPFSKYTRIFRIFTEALFRALPVKTHEAVEYIASPGIVIPLLVLLVLIIYYLLSLTGALREANNDLKIQLRRERTEERRKMFKIAGGKKKEDTPFNRWKMIIPAAKAAVNPDAEKEPKPSVLTTGKQTGFAGAAKRAALKARKLEEDDGNATDNDIDQVSLPDDSAKKSQKTTVNNRKPSCTDSIASTRSEIPVIKISKESDPNPSKPIGSGGGGISSSSSGPSTSAKPGPSKIEPVKVEPAKRQRVLRALINAAKGRSQKILRQWGKRRNNNKSDKVDQKQEEDDGRPASSNSAIIDIDEFASSDVRPQFVRFQSAFFNR